MLQSTDPEKLSNKERSIENAWISLERGNRIDFVGRLEACGDGNRHVSGRDGERKNTGRNGWNLGAFWVMWKPSARCKGNSLESVKVSLAKSPSNSKYRA